MILLSLDIGSVGRTCYGLNVVVRGSMLRKTLTVCVVNDCCAAIYSDIVVLLTSEEERRGDFCVQEMAGDCYVLITVLVRQAVHTKNTQNPNSLLSSKRQNRASFALPPVLLCDGCDLLLTIWILNSGE